VNAALCGHHAFASARSMTFPVAGSPACFFARDSLGPVAYEGRELWLSYRFPVVAGDRVHIFIERFSARPRQGLRVMLNNRRHRIRINPEEANQFILWCDTAPRHVEVDVTRSGRRGEELILMNAWQDEKYGTMLYGLNWAAMDVHREPDGSVMLRCSDGYGREPCFDDLIVRVIVEPVSPSRPAA
jgi:hypothetical protein